MHQINPDTDSYPNEGTLPMYQEQQLNNDQDDD